MKTMRRLIARARHMGFEGPYYTGLLGKARFVLENTVCRRELLFVATADSHAAAAMPTTPALTLSEIDAHSGFAIHAPDLEREYYPGYTDTWRAPFGWGERALVASHDGRFSGVAWIQSGVPEGFPTYWGRLFDGDARILRVGVVPSMRRRGVNTVMLHGALGLLFAAGRRRVFIECSEHNVPSLRTFLKIGFHPIGLLDVFETPGLRGCVRWRSPEELASALALLGATREPGAARQ